MIMMMQRQTKRRQMTVCCCDGDDCTTKGRAEATRDGGDNGEARWDDGRRQTRRMERSR